MVAVQSRRGVEIDDLAQPEREYIWCLRTSLV